MARQYIPPGSVVAGFPSVVFTPWPRLNKANDHDPIPAEAFTVPASPHIVVLDYGILGQVPLTITSNSTVLTRVGWEETPGPDEVAVHMDRGLLRFHSSRAAQTGTVASHPLGSVNHDMWEMVLQKELRAVQQYCLTIEGGGGGGSATENHAVHVAGVPSVALVGKIYVPAGALDERNVTRLTVFAGDSESLTAASETVLYVTVEATAINGAAVTLETSGTVNWATATPALAIDTSGGDVVLNVFCTDNAGGHGNLNLEVTVE